VSRPWIPKGERSGLLMLTAEMEKVPRREVIVSAFKALLYKGCRSCRTP